MTTKKLNIKTKLLNTFRRLLMFPAAEKLLGRAIANGNRLAAKLAPNYYQYPGKTFRQADIHGIHMRIDISDYIGHFVYFRFDDQGFRQLLKLAAQHKTIIDAGANIGYTALAMAQQHAGKVFAFEPDPYNFSCLDKNCELNPGLDVVPVNYGLGAKNDRLKLAVVTPDNFGGNRISTTAATDYSLVDITTIDAYCIKNELNGIGLVKIDVEGFEMEVLKGAQKTIQKNRPTLFIEVNDTNLREQGSSAGELVEFLESYYPVLEDAATGAIVHSADDFKNCHFDLIARN